MRKSENFDLNLYEGTDIFNPLTTDVPNYEKIDAQMEKNYNLAVGKSTELKTGTVHALTRENADCPMIHFTATSNFTSNDTFTVDGVQVSALLVDGSTLPTNCYIIGSEVICYLKGTLLTFFLSGSVSKDSEKLGGELPSYYGKSSDISNLQQVVNSSSQLIANNTNEITNLSELEKPVKGTLQGSFEGSYSLIKKNNRVVFNGTLYNITNKNFATFPLGFLPKNINDVLISGDGFNGSWSHPISLVLNKNGTAELQSSIGINSTYYYKFSGVWDIEDN